METYSLISSQTVAGSSTTTVTFDNIPQVYDDLVLRYSGKANVSAWDAALTIRPNNNSNGVYRWQTLKGGTATATATGDDYMWFLYTPTTGLTAASLTGTDPTDTFAVGEIYFFDYASTNKVKNFLGQSASEGNTITSGTVYRSAFHGMVEIYDAITSMTVSYSGNNLVANSVFSLYGIKG